MRRLLIVAALVLLCASAYSEVVSWTYRQSLSEAPDSVRYLLYHGFDSVGTFTGPSEDSLYFTLSVQDTTINWVVAKIYWDDYDSAQSSTLWFGNWWSARGSSYYYPIRYWWCDPPDSALRRIWIDNVLTYTDTLSGPLYVDADSIIITDTTGVRFSYTEYWPGGLVSGFTDVVPTMSPYTTSEIIIERIVDTFYMPPPATQANYCNVWGRLTSMSGNGISGAQVTFVLPRPVANSCDSSAVVQRITTVRTDSTGYFNTDLVWSSCVDDSKYYVTVVSGHSSWKRAVITVPDTTSYRITW